MAPSSTSMQSPAQTTMALPVVSASSSGHTKILWAVIGAVAGLCAAIGLLVVYKMCRQRRRRATSIAPSAAYERHYVYASLANPDSQNTTVVKDEMRSSEDSRRTLPKISTPGSTSYLSLPVITDDASSVSSYSPAVASSELHGHGSSPIVPLSHFTRLVPLRRGMDGRV
ncbi:hypothetical protein C8F01DRAFT_79060 [Mycena amicta]|nr:hypothetical protein C8F01DRAFT_79060 [Mycena amicta]